MNVEIKPKNSFIFDIKYSNIRFKVFKKLLSKLYQLTLSDA